MWKLISKTKRLLILGAALIAACSLIVFPMIAGAGPSSTPTGGNVDANFDSLTSIDVTATRDINAEGDIKTTSGNFYLPAGSSTSSSGVIYKGSTPFLHNYGGGNNVFLGTGAGNLSMTGIAQNTGIGYWALRDNVTGSQNTAIGSEALEKNTTGTNNTAVGAMSMFAGTNTGSFNTAVGKESAYSNTGGGFNTSIGYGALRANASGSNNTALGTSAGRSTLGSGNIFVGNQAGYNETGSNQLYIDNSNTSTPLIGGDFATNQVGINTGSPSADLHVLNIDGSNSFRVDDAASDTTPFIVNADGNVGIGTATPASKLQVSGDVNSTTVTATKFLDSDDTNFYLEPATFSYLNDIQLSGRIIDYPSGSYYLDPASNSYLNNVYGGGSYFFKHYDRDNTNYFMDPSSAVTSLVVAGKVGIGTIAPSKKLHVVDGDSTMTFGDSSGVQVYNSESSVGEVRLGAAWSRPGVYSSNNLNLLATSGLALSGRGNNTDMYLNTSGNVGIGTTTPAARLHVEDPANNVVGTFGGFGIGVTATGNGGGGLFDDANSSGSVWLANNDVGITAMGNTTAGYFDDLNNVDEEVSLASGTWSVNANGPINVDELSGILYASGSEAIYYDGSMYRWGYGGNKNYFADNVGIGTTSPDQRLDVAGNVDITGVLDVNGDIYDSTGNLTLNDTVSVNGVLITRDINAYATSGYGIYSRGLVGGFFQDLDTSKYGYVGYNNYSLYGNGDIYTIGNISNTGSNIAGTYVEGDYLRGSRYGGMLYGYLNHELVWHDGNLSSWGYGGTSNVFWDPVGVGVNPLSNVSVNARGNSYGVWGEGSTMGGRFKDSNSTGYAYLGYGGYALYGVGTVRGVGSYLVGSDSRLKKNVKTIENALDKVLALRGVEFEWNEKSSQEGKDIGFIAQEVEKVMPELVMPPSEDNEDIDEARPETYYGMKYGNVTALLTAAVQELKSEKDNEIAELKEEVAALRVVVCELKPEAEICN